MLAVWLFDPLAPLAAGFWLSFTAMATLLLSDVIRERRPEVRGWLESLRAGLLVQWRVSLALVPATLIWFSSISFAGLVVNVAAIPLFSFVLVPLVLLATGAQTVSTDLARWLWTITEQIYLIIWPAMLAVAEQPFSRWLTSASPLALVALALSVPIWLLPTPWRWRLASGLLLIPLVWPVAGSFSSIPLDHARIQVLDGGDGAALLVLTRRHTLVYDTAEVFGSDGRRAESLVLPALRAAGRTRVDHLVLSRSHGLRAAGAGRLLARTTVGAITAGGAWPGAPEAVQSCATPRRWQWDGVELTTFAPPGEDASCLLRIAVPNGPSLLIPERVDANEARALAADPALRDALAASVVLAPRRGSPSAVTVGFVAAVAPQWIIVSAREHDERRERQLVARWGVPPDRIVSTSRVGMIEIELAPAAPARVAAGLSSRSSRIWHAPGVD